MKKILDVDDFCEWYSSLNILAYGEIEIEDMIKDFKMILEWKRDGVMISENTGRFTVKEYWLILSILGECIEYGTSPRSAWLNEFGYAVIDCVEKHEKEIIEYLK